MRRTLLLLLALLVVPGLASASGGLFADAVQTVAVEQNLGRVLLRVNDDGTVTAAIEISYSGSPEAFAWVIPVPEEPVLDVVPPSALRMLDAATAPRIVPPPLASPPLGDDDDDDDSAWDDEDPVAPDVYELEQVGPYEPTLLDPEDPDGLIDWLRGHDYLVTDEMEPYLASYVERGMSFLALRLAPEAGVADIQPLAISWTADEPSLPLILTGVAAEPEMGIAVFLAGGSTYEPVTHASLLVDPDLLQADPRTGRNNYYGLVSWLADQEGGQAFFTEYSDATADLAGRLDALELSAADADEARLFLDELAEDSAWLTRLYTRASGEELVADAVFSSMNNQAAVGPLHDLSGRTPVPLELPGVPCGDTYCGPGGSCATTDVPGVDGCSCDDGFAARAIAGPLVAAAEVAPSLTCQDTGFDLMASVEADLDDPCAAWDCGLGACVVTGGVAACACQDGAAGIPVDGRVSCVAASEVYGPDQLLWPGWPDWPDPGEDDGGGGGDRATQATAAGLESGCGCAAPGDGAVGALGLLAIVGLYLRRR